MLANGTIAQEYWGNDEYIGGGSIFLQAEPSFGAQPGEILLADDYPYRLYRGAYEAFDRLLPDSLSVNGYDDCSPAISADGQRLYFASNRPGGYGGYDIWMTEKSGGEWSMPNNLGQAINSELDEISPSLTGDESKLFFVRADDSGPWGIPMAHIFRSVYWNDQWGGAEIMPAPVTSESLESCPAISYAGDKLYFISTRPNDLPGELGVWVSYRQNEQWLEPTPLLGFVNYYWEQCGWGYFGHPVSIDISHDASSIVFNKIDIYEITFCFDAETNIYVADLQTDIDDKGITKPEQLSLFVYPNPFNSSLYIKTAGGSADAIEIFDIRGREIISFKIESGENSIVWDGRDRLGDGCPSGIYFVRMISNENTVTRRAVLLK